jgi:uncharacterized membrane protein
MIARNHWIAIVGLFLVGLVVSAIIWPTLPERVPTHWNFQGQVDGWGPRWQAAWLLPAVALGVVGLLSALPLLGPFRRNLESFRITYGRILVLVMAVFVAMHIVFVLNAAGRVIPVGRTLAVIIGTMLAVLGNWLGKLRRNFYIGIRTPWTIANEEVWERTHRVGGPLFVIHGVIVALSGIFGNDRGCFLVLMGGLIAIALFCTIYSLVLYRRLGGVDELSPRETG